MKTTITYSGISFSGLLFVVFLVLKLTHVIDWSWWWVTAPLWGGFAILAALFVIFTLIYVTKFIVLTIKDL